MTHATEIVNQNPKLASGCNEERVMGLSRERRARAKPPSPPWPLFNLYFRVGGSAALIDDTLSTPAILQIGCEKSLCKLGSDTIP
jgi:hypothetical protein